jgi:type II secretory pathway pseudopilin PulG
MSRPLDPNPSKANLYRRKWRAKNPKPPSAKKLEMERVRALLGTQLGSKLGKKELYKARRREKSRWDAVYKAGHSKVFGDTLYDYADALFKRRQEQEDKQKRGASAQAEYQRRYRAKKKAQLPESIAISRILARLPEDMHDEFHSFVESLRRYPKPETVFVPAPEPKPESTTKQATTPPEEPKPLTFEQEQKAWAASSKVLTPEQRHQAVLKAGHDLTFDGEIWFHEDALWQESRK